MRCRIWGTCGVMSSVSSGRRRSSSETAVFTTCNRPSCAQQPPRCPQDRGNLHVSSIDERNAELRLADNAGEARAALGSVRAAARRAPPWAAWCARLPLPMTHPSIATCGRTFGRCSAAPAADASPLQVAACPHSYHFVCTRPGRCKARRPRLRQPAQRPVPPASPQLRSSLLSACGSAHRRLPTGPFFVFLAHVRVSVAVSAGGPGSLPGILPGPQPHKGAVAGDWGKIKARRASRGALSERIMSVDRPPSDSVSGASWGPQATTASRPTSASSRRRTRWTASSSSVSATQRTGSSRSGQARASALPSPKMKKASAPLQWRLRPIVPQAMPPALPSPLQPARRWRTGCWRIWRRLRRGGTRR